MPEASPSELDDGRYLIEKRLGEGAMATVYLAFDSHNESWCAAKILKKSLVKKPNARRRFESEARILMSLDHRNIIKGLAADTEQNPPWLVLELAEGGCLIDWINSHGKVPPRMAVDIGIQICKGLAAAHDSGIVHRDVKPHNILMNHRGVCKLTDFGIAQGDPLGPDLTRTDTALGTLGYVAPEQRASAKTVDHRADIYSAGATLYAMIVGEPSADLFVADRVTELMAAVPEPLRPVIMRATTYRPDERYDSAHELARMLHEVRGKLAPDPSETPQLALRRQDTRERPASRVAETFDVPPPTPSAPDKPELVNEPTMDTGSTDQEEPADLSNSLAELKRVALVVVIAAFATMGVLGAIGSAMRSGEARQQAVVAQAAYFETVGSSAGLVDELVTLGAHRSMLQSKWDAWDAAGSPPEKNSAAHAYSAAVAADVSKYTARVQTGDRVTARTVVTKVEELQNAERVSDQAAAAAASSGCGG